MAKRKTRKRTNANCPAKGRLKDMADALWSAASKIDWNHRCAICGKRDGLNSHHLAPRQHVTTRYDLRNAICLCCHCHQFSPDVSPHLNAAGFLLWLENHQPELHKWYTELVADGSYRRFEGTTNAQFYMDTIRRLKQYVPDDDYVRIVGQKFSLWLEDTK